MKKFNFKKLGILLVTMLIGGMVLVGSASAWNEEHELSEDDYYNVWVGGSLLWGGEGANYYGQAGTVSGADADCIYVYLELYHNVNTRLQADDGTGWDTDFVEVTNLYDHHAVMTNPYARVEMSGANPIDEHDGLVCYLT